MELMRIRALKLCEGNEKSVLIGSLCTLAITIKTIFNTTIKEKYFNCLGYEN